MWYNMAESNMKYVIFRLMMYRRNEKCVFCECVCVCMYASICPNIVTVESRSRVCA